MTLDDDLLLEALMEQEIRLQFKRFDSEDALQLGLMLIDMCKKENKVVVIDITKWASTFLLCF